MKKSIRSTTGLLLAVMLITALMTGCGGGGSDSGPGYYNSGWVETNPSPTVTSVSQNLSPGQECTVSGTNFGSTREGNASYVSFVDSNSTPTNATQYSYWSDTSIRCIIPALTPGRSYYVVVTVVNAAGSSSSTYSSTGTNTMTIASKTPVIASIAPAILNQGASTPLVITGTDFGAAQGNGYIRFGPEAGGIVQGTVTSWSSSQISCTMPATVAAASFVPVYVITNESLASNGYNITVAPAGNPIITKVSPTSASIGSTPVISLTGTNFGAAQGNGSVTAMLNTTAPVTITTVTSWSDTGITLALPAGLTGYEGVISVFVTTDKGTISNATSITVGGNGKVYALFVGINAYSGNALQWCVSDANGMKANLSSSALWQGAEIVTLLDSAATKKAITDAVTSLGAKTGTNDTFFMYYSGHGSGDSSLAYICPVDTDYTAASFISDVELQALLTPVKGKKCIIFDSCHSGGFVGKVPGARVRYVPLRGQKPSVFTGGGFAKSLYTVPNMVFLGAARGSELSWESSALEHGVFTYYVMQGLGTGTIIGPAGGAGSTFVSAQQCWDYAAFRTSNYTTQNMDPQQPVIQDNNSNSLIIKQ